MRTENFRWETAFSNLEHAQMRRLTEVEKISWLSDQFKDDPRSQIQSCFVSSASSNESSSLIIDDLISENATSRVASFDTSNMTSSSTEPHVLYRNTLSNTGPPPFIPPLQNKYKPNNNYDPNNQPIKRMPRLNHQRSIVAKVTKSN